MGARVKAYWLRVYGKDQVHCMSRICWLEGGDPGGRSTTCSKGQIGARGGRGRPRGQGGGAGGDGG